jgi:outer membrane protein assembly factor BamB
MWATAFALLVGVWCVATAAASSAQVIATTGDWPQLQGGATHPGSVARSAAPPLSERWSTGVPLSGPGDRYGLSAPAVAGTTAVAVGPLKVLGFDVDTGRQIFAMDRDLGPPASPAVAQVKGRSVVVYTEGFGDEAPGASPTPTTATPTASASGAPPAATGPVDSHVQAFDLRTQEPLWDPIQLDAASKTGVTVTGETAYVGDTVGTVYAIDLASGKVLWRGTVGGILSTPLAATADVVVGTVQGEARTAPAVVALKASDGTRAWRYSSEALGLISGPAIGGSRVYVGITDGTVRALDLAAGTESWQTRLNSPVSPYGGVAVAGDAVYAVDLNAQLYKLEASTGARVWDFALNEFVQRGWPVVAGTAVFVATQEGNLAAVDTASGHLVWQSGDGTGPLRDLAPLGDQILAVRGGPDAGLTAFAHDDTGTLVDEVSPTEADPLVLLRNFVIAGVPIAVIAIFAGRALSRRMGPAFIMEDDDGEARPSPDEGDA